MKMIPQAAAYKKRNESAERMRKQERDVQPPPLNPARRANVIEIEKLRADADEKRWLQSAARVSDG